MVWGLCCTLWQTTHSWWPRPGVGVGEEVGAGVDVGVDVGVGVGVGVGVEVGVGVGEWGVGDGDVAWATGVAAAQNVRATPRANSEPETKVAKPAGRKCLLLPEENVFFISCFLAVKSVWGRLPGSGYIKFFPSGQRESNPHGQLGRLELYH
jgi:hypothetical protein